MLNKLELEIVKVCKVHGFAAYLQRAWADFPTLERDAASRIYPETQHIQKVLGRMERGITEFDFAYFVQLPQEATNPLQGEQEAWKLLSPILKDYLTRFKQFVSSYSSDKVSDESRQQLLGLVQEGWQLLQKWDTISKAYNPKYEFAIYNRTGWTEKGLQEREEAVKVLICELSSPPVGGGRD